MLLSVVSVLVVAQSSSKIPEGLMNNPVFKKNKNLSESTIHADPFRNFKNLYALYLYEVNSDMPCVCDTISLSFRNLIYPTDGSKLQLHPPTLYRLDVC